MQPAVAYASGVDPILGVDLGTTYTAAAAISDAHGKPEMVGLGNRTAEIPSVLLRRPDGEFLFGEPAERRAFGEPDRVARQFKRRLGDATPLLLGGSPFSPEALLGRLLRFVVDRATDQGGTQFSATVVCHPANYGPYRMELLGQAAKMAELDNVYFLPEPVAAAVHYTDQARHDPGEIVVVYDFGGGTFDVAVLRRTDEAFEVIGTPAGLEHLGGLDLDEAVFGHVVQTVGAALAELDATDPAVVAAVGRLRDECKAAKEALSSDTDTSIPVLLPGIQTEVRLTRSEFEGMILPSVLDTVATTTRAIREAGLEPGDVGRILLVGGSARVPLVSQLLSEELGRPIAIDAHPKHSIALGAARWGAIEVEAGIQGASAAEAPMVAAAVAAVDTDPVAPSPGAAPQLAPEPEPVLVSPAEQDPPAGTQEVEKASAEPAPEPARAIPQRDPSPEPFVPPKRAAPRVAIVAVAVALIAAVAAFAVFQSGRDEGRKEFAATVTVDGDVSWTESEIDLVAGDKVTVEASGKAFHNEMDSTGPDGIVDPVANAAAKDFSVIGDSNHNALIAKIGPGGEPFFVGGFAQFTAKATGRLFFGANDTGIQNNSGKYTAKVTVRPA